MREQMMLFVLVTILLTGVFGNDEPDSRNHKKRQIYREQVLPHAGGKIPDTAFQTDRLFLNRLQKQGIAIPDGVVPEQRYPDVAPYHNKASRTVYRVALSSDGRFIPNEGRYYFQSTPSVETTYLFPQIQNQAVHYPSKMPAYPTYKQFQLHNPQLDQANLQVKKKKTKQPYLYSAPNAATIATGSDRVKMYGKTQVGQKNNVIPFSPTSSVNNQYPPTHYGTSHLFKEFDNLFNNFDLHEPSSGLKGHSLHKHF